MHRTTSRVALGLLLVASCGGAHTRDDAGAAEDAGTMMDADERIRDTGMLDTPVVRVDATDARISDRPDTRVTPDDVGSLDAPPGDTGCGLPFFCGDRVCSPAEDCVTCAIDCGVCPCGDGVCRSSETCVSCAMDCGACPCGDGTCDQARGESCVDCAADCRCPCDDGRCSYREDEVCPTGGGDCGFVDYCGNLVCGGFETGVNCPRDCSCGVL